MGMSTLRAKKKFEECRGSPLHPHPVPPKDLTKYCTGNLCVEELKGDSRIRGSFEPHPAPGPIQHKI